MPTTPGSPGCSSTSRWSDLKIDFGSAWKREIEAALTRSKVAILLLSPAFFSSRFIWEFEMPRILAHQSTGMQVLPIIVRSCAWRLKKSIAELQALPSNNWALALLGDAEADAELASIVYAVADVVGRIPAGDAPPEQPDEPARRLAQAASVDGDEADEAGVAGQRLAIRGDRPDVPHPLTARTVTIWPDGETSAICPVRSDGRDLVASPGADGAVRIWDPRTGDDHRVLSAPGGPVRVLAAVATDGRYLLASAGDDGAVRIWDLATGTLEHTLAGPAAAVWSLCKVDAGGLGLLAAGGEDERVWLWDPSTGQCVAALEVLDGPVRSLCAVPVDGRELLACGGDAGRVVLWDATDAAHERRILDRRDGPVRALSVVPVGGRELLVSAGDDGIVRIIDPWDAVTLHELTGHAGAVRAACPVRTDGRALLATAGTDASVRLWNTTLVGMEDVVPVIGSALAVAPSGRHLVVGTDTGVVVLELLGS
jgi:WD40 repeat protein